MSPDKRVLVTGHNGFIGRHLCSSLKENNFSVIGIGRGLNNLSYGRFLSYEIDILNQQEVSNIIQANNPQVIVHLAGGPSRQNSINDFQKYLDISQQVSNNIIDAAIKLPCLEKFIFLGSCEEYGCIDPPFLESSQELPSSAYGLSKLMITRYLQTLSSIFDFPAIILRPSIVYGPGQSKNMFLSDLINHLIEKKVFNMSSGLQTREFIFIDDLIRAILLSIEAKDCNGEIINISSCSPIIIKDLAKVLESQILGADSNMIKFGAKDYRVGESLSYYADNTKASRLLGWSPLISLEDGIQRTIEWKQEKINPHY